MPKPRRHLSRLVDRGRSAETLDATAEHLNIDRKEKRRIIKDARDRNAVKATRLDVLGEFYVALNRRANYIDELYSQLRGKTDAPASAHNAFRLLLKDQDVALLEFEKLRTRLGRDQCKPAEQRVRRQKARKARDKRLWELMGLYRDRGYYYVPGMGMEQPECNLDPETIARRDVVRLRKFPKSPYEDRILAEEYGATFDCEKDIDPETLCKDELPNDELGIDPTAEAPRRPSYTFQDEPLISKLTAERARAWNTAFARAEAHVAAVDHAQGRPWVCQCCQNTYAAEFWHDEPPGVTDSQWIGKFKSVIVLSLIWFLTLGALMSSSSSPRAAARGPQVQHVEPLVSAPTPDQVRSPATPHSLTVAARPNPPHPPTTAFFPPQPPRFSPHFHAPPPPLETT